MLRASIGLRVTFAGFGFTRMLKTMASLLFPGMDKIKHVNVVVLSASME